MKLFHAVMAGGIGSRLWPLSRKAHPKQFLQIASDKSMIADTFTRFENLDFTSHLVLGSQTHKFLISDVLERLDINADVILEPVGKNTAPAAVLAALHVVKTHEDGLILLSPSDHAIAKPANLEKMIQQGIPYAMQGNIITFGIAPTAPETGYGYIKTDVNVADNTNLYRINKFVEKPDLKTAQEYIEEGGYLWNSGIFLFKASMLLEEIHKYQPRILQACNNAYRLEKNTCIEGGTTTFFDVNEEIFATCPEDSLDYAIMEKTDKGMVAEVVANWSDLGSWNSIWEYRDKDKNGNVFDADVLAVNTTNSYIRAENKKLIATIGLDNVAVVETDDALLIANLDSSQEVKSLVNTLKSEDRAEYVFHREVHRPWGRFDSIDSSDRYQVKRITVKPGAKLSVQMHFHRAEHWVVVGGTALVRKGFDENNLKEHLLRENESIYIEIGEIHSLENPGKMPLEIIEVQSGAYLDEDDIVRFSDVYGRGNK